MGFQFRLMLLTVEPYYYLVIICFYSFLYISIFILSSHAREYKVIHFIAFKSFYIQFVSFNYNYPFSSFYAFFYISILPIVIISFFLHFTLFFKISILPIRTRKHKYIGSDVCTSLMQCTLHYSPICFHSSLGCEVVEHDTQIHTLHQSLAKQLISQPYREREREKTSHHRTATSSPTSLSNHSFR